MASKTFVNGLDGCLTELTWWLPSFTKVLLLLFLTRRNTNKNGASLSETLRPVTGSGQIRSDRCFV